MSRAAVLFPVAWQDVHQRLFALFLISSVLWSAVGWIHREPSLVVLQGAFTAINLLGIYRWAAF